MSRMALTRIGQLVIVLLLASVVLFIALHVLPGDPARRLLGTQATIQQVEAKRRQLGLDRPLPVQYEGWLVGALHGDLGTSLVSDEPVSTLLRQAVPVTVQLGLLALVLSLALGVLIALVSAARPGGVVDTALTFYSVMASSVPSFVWGLVLVLVVSLTFRLLPAGGYVSLISNPVEAIRTLALPVIALSLPSVGVFARVGRAALIEVLHEPYIQFARSKGVGWFSIYVTHGLRNVAASLITLSGAELAYIIGDAIAVEWVFSIPGVGKLMMDAFLARDYTTIEGAAVAITLIVVLANLVADLVTAQVDPRVRLEASTAWM
jgi:peptide/nickel transport system permease protein